MKNKLTLLVLNSLFLAACSNGFESAKIDVDSAVQANGASKTYGEWHESDKNPEQLIAKWRSQISKNEMTSADVCQALDQMDAQHLTLFENELADEGNKDIVGECAEALKTKIDNYYLNDRAMLTANIGNFFENDVNLLDDKGSTIIQGVGSSKTSNFKFDTITKSIDTTVGYHVGPNRYNKETKKYNVVDAKQVVLTFDDGPRDNTMKILKVLEEVGAKAMFFQVGDRLVKKTAGEKYQPTEIEQNIVAAGHVFGGHTMSHENLAKGGLESFGKNRAQIYDGLNAIIKTVGWVYPVFRFPYGNSTAALKNDLTKMGIGSFYWNVDSEDWKSTRNSAQLLAYTMGQVRSQKGGVVLFHDIHERTTQILPQFLKTLHDEGYQIVLLKPTKVIKSPINYNPVPPKP
jgi:peptidoglycan/xylan/chitin deacetylase (PgdA/CDA1 family)